SKSSYHKNCIRIFNGNLSSLLMLLLLRNILPPLLKQLILYNKSLSYLSMPPLIRCYYKGRTFPFFRIIFIPPNRNNDLLSTTFFIAAAGFPLSSVPSSTVPIPTVTPNDATVPLSSNWNFSIGPPLIKATILLAQVSAC